MMALASWEVLDLAGAPGNPWGELRLVWRILRQEEPAAPVIKLLVARPALARAA